jgi:hypothetical protein
MDVQHPLALVETTRRTNDDTFCVLARKTRFRHDMCHFFASDWAWSRQYPETTNRRPLSFGLPLLAEVRLPSNTEQTLAKDRQLPILARHFLEPRNHLIGHPAERLTCI